MAVIDSFIEEPQADGTIVKIATKYDDVSGIHKPRAVIEGISTGGSATLHSVLLVADETTDVTGGSFTTFDGEDLYNNTLGTLTRSTYVGQKALLHSGANAGIWTITAHPNPWTPQATQPLGGELVVVMLTEIGANNQPRLMIGANADGLNSLTDPTTTATTFAAVERDPSKFLTVVETDDLSEARPSGAGSIYWKFTDDAIDPGASGENIVNGQTGDQWFVPDA
jgi:hypothetical protein